MQIELWMFRGQIQRHKLWLGNARFKLWLGLNLARAKHKGLQEVQKGKQ